MTNRSANSAVVADRCADMTPLGFLERYLLVFNPLAKNFMTLLINHKL